MVTYFNKSDLISFGKFLVGEERKQRFTASQEEHGHGLTLEERLGQVHDADFRNWKEQRQNETRKWKQDPDQMYQIADLKIE